MLFVESEALISSRRWHRQRLHLVLSAMAHFAAELRAEGFEVDHRRAGTLSRGLQDHIDEYHTPHVVRDGADQLGRARDARAAGRRTVAQRPVPLPLRQLRRLGRWPEAAHDGGLLPFRPGPRLPRAHRRGRRWLPKITVGGKWNFDHDNREPPPSDGRAWPLIERFELDDIDRAVLDRLPVTTFGADPDGAWPVTRAQAMSRLREFVDHGLALFGPHQGAAMLAAEWKLAHSVLSSSMNLGLLHPAEVVAAAESAFRRGAVPLNSVEGFIRQVIGFGASTCGASTGCGCPSIENATRSPPHVQSRRFSPATLAPRWPASPA